MRVALWPDQDAERHRQELAETLAAANDRQFASDAATDNVASRALHHALGFVATERVVFFRKVVSAPPVRRRLTGKESV